MALTAKDEVRFAGNGIESLAEDLRSTWYKVRMKNPGDLEALKVLDDAEHELRTLAEKLQNFGRD
jgi:hypothetical protein